MWRERFAEELMVLFYQNAEYKTISCTYKRVKFDEQKTNKSVIKIIFMS